MRGCIEYHFDGLLSQLIVALHHLILFIAMWLTSEDTGYDWVGGDVTECIVYMFWAMTLYPFLSGPFPFWLGGVFMAQLSKVLKVVCWAGSVPFPPVSLQRQVV